MRRTLVGSTFASRSLRGILNLRLLPWMEILTVMRVSAVMGRLVAMLKAVVSLVQAGAPRAVT